MKKKSTKLRKEIRDWLILLTIFGLFFFTGARSLLQRALLYTGLFNPSTTEQSGEASYNLQLQDRRGNLVNLSELKGKTIFMNFWATWCPPCVAEMPGIEQLYQDTKSEDIAFVMISVDENPMLVDQFIEEHGYSFPVYFLAGSVPGTYRGNSIPRTYVISPEGKIATQKMGMANYNSGSFKSFFTNLGK